LLKAILVDARRWREIMNMISTLLEEAEFKASPEGLELRAMNDSKVAMIDLDLPATFFDRYECDVVTSLRIKVKSMLDILEGVGAKETIEVSYIKEQAKLIVYLHNEYERIFKLTTLAVEEEFERKPSTVFTVKAKVSTTSLKKVLSESEKMGDVVTIETQADKIEFTTIGLTGNVTSTFKKGSPSLIELFVEKESTATYSLDLLKSIVMEASSISDTVNIEYSTDNVLRLDFVFPQGKLHLYLSPSLETN
jgi:proliferating cell nuclear antigen